MDFWVSCVIMFFIFIALTPGVLLSLPMGSGFKGKIGRRFPIFEHITDFSSKFCTDRADFIINTLIHALVFVFVYYVIHNLVDRTVDCEECEAECPGMRRR
jgi:hypothetical protein